MEFKNSKQYKNGHRRADPAAVRDSTPINTPLSTHQTPAATTKTTQLRRIMKRRTLLVAATSIILLTVAVAATAHLISLTQENATTKTLSNDQPTYATILPEGKTIKDLGGWQRISPPGSDPVYVFADTIGSTAVTVSEQPLPNTFESDIDNSVAELAKTFNATNKITAETTVVYLGISAKGPQSAIFMKNELLVLIKAQAKISDEAWISYINALKK